MKKYEKEIELKKDLDTIGFRYGDRFSSTAFVVSFLDVSSGALVYECTSSTPINALRVLPTILEQKKLGVQDLKIVLEFGFDYKTRECRSIEFELSPYLLFPKEIKDKKVEDKK